MTSTHAQMAHDRCRTYGHAWFEIDATSRPQWGYYLWLKCERCDTIRMDTINLVGELSTRSYRYPEGYKESQPVTKNDYRLRTLVQHRTASGRPRRLRSVG